jgi:hypothetical protein
MARRGVWDLGRLSLRFPTLGHWIKAINKFDNFKQKSKTCEKNVDVSILLILEEINQN